MAATSPRSEPATGAPVVELRDVCKRFGPNKAVDRASLALDAGEFVTILGPSGCGKTTLLRMVAGFEQPTSGEIIIQGRPVAAVPPHRRRIGMVFQRLALFPHMTAAQNIAYPLERRGYARADIPERVQNYLALVKLEGLGARRPHELSGGQQQRVAIARALSFEPDLLLLDEPLSALDKKLREEMQLEFRRIQQELGVTTVNVTHDQREALVMSDRIVVMNGGVIQQADTPDAVYRRPGNAFVARFLGMTSTFKGAVEAGGTVRCGSASLACTEARIDIGTRVDCHLRAEQVQLVSAGSSAPNTVVEGVVAQRIFEGDREVLAVRVPVMGDVVLFAFAHGGSDHDVDARVQLGWNSKDLLVFASAA